MERDDTVYVGHMLDMTRRAVKAIKYKSRAQYDEDDILRLGLTHLVQVIGEAARKVSPDFQSEHQEIPWRRIIGMRHRIVHDYMRIDEDISQKTCLSYLEFLNKSCPMGNRKIEKYNLSAL